MLKILALDAALLAATPPGRDMLRVLASLQAGPRAQLRLAVLLVPGTRVAAARSLKRITLPVGAGPASGVRLAARAFRTSRSVCGLLASSRSRGRPLRLVLASGATTLASWTELPLVLALRHLPPSPVNLAVGLSLYLGTAGLGWLGTFDVTPRRLGVRVQRAGRAFDVTVHVDAGGRPTRIRRDDGERAEEEEAVFLESLQAHGQLAPTRGPLPEGATHRVGRGADGRPTAIRRRFSAA